MRWVSRGEDNMSKSSTPADAGATRPRGCRTELRAGETASGLGGSDAARRRWVRVRGDGVTEPAAERRFSSCGERPETM